MNRRDVVFALFSIAIARRAVAQGAPAKAWRIGFVGPISAADAPARAKLFRDSLRELGHGDAALQVEIHATDGQFEPFPRLVQELLAAKVDLLVTQGTPATLAAKRATAAVPVVMMAVADPVGAGLVASLARPGANVTGMALFVQGLEIAGKRVQLLRELAPQASRIALPWDPRNPGDSLNFREMEKAVRAANLAVVSVELPDPARAASVLEKSLSARPDSLLVTEGGSNVIARKEIVTFAARHRLPAIYGVRQFVDAGGLVCYGPSYTDQWRGAAYYVDRIIKGARPADLPVQQPSRFEMVVNLRAAKAAGFTVPPSLLLRADEVIE